MNEKQLSIRQLGLWKTTVLEKATQELKILAVLMIAKLTPIAVFADKFQEEFPEHEKTSKLLRKWEKCQEK